MRNGRALIRTARWAVVRTGRIVTRASRIRVRNVPKLAAACLASLSCCCCCVLLWCAAAAASRISSRARERVRACVRASERASGADERAGRRAYDGRESDRGPARTSEALESSAHRRIIEARHEISEKRILANAHHETPRAHNESESKQPSAYTGGRERE